MLIEIDCDPNEEQYVLEHAVIVRRTLGTSLALLLQELHRADLKRGTFIGKGMDGEAVTASAEKAQRAAEVKAEMFNKPDPAELERKAELARLDKEIEMEKRKVRW
jgi:hypothetical protein